jgi:hypothetical protein
LFRDPTGKSQTFTYGGGASPFLVPYTIPYTIGASTIDESKTLVYAGNAPSFPNLIRITGPITDAILTNQTLDKTLDFTGITIAAGDYYDINLTFPEHTVLDSTGANKANDLTAASYLDTFHIASTKEAAGGVNVIRLTGSAITAATKVEINYKEYFKGV